MFKKIDPNPRLDIFTAPSMQLGSRASKKYSAPNAWHNQFYSLVTTKINEEIFKPLFPGGKKSGRPNASVKAVTKQGSRKRWRIPWNNKTGWRHFEDKDIKAYQLRKQIESLSLEEQHKRNNVEAAMFQYSFHTRNGKTRYRGLLKHRMHAYSRCMWMNLRRMVIFQISTFQRSIFALFGPIREAFGSFMAISRKIFTSGADCYVSLSMTILVMLDSKYALFKVDSVIKIFKSNKK